MNWSKTMTNKGWRVFPDTIRDAYMKQIGAEGEPTEPTDEAFVDLPGMIMADRTHQELEFDGLMLTFPTTDFKYLLNELKEGLEEILVGGVPCVKLRGWLTGLVITPDQRKRLVAQMEEILPAVVVAARREDEEFNRRLSSAQAKSPVQIMSARQERMKQEGDKDVPKPN